MRLPNRFSESHVNHAHLLDQRVEEYIDAHADVLLKQIYHGV